MVIDFYGKRDNREILRPCSNDYMLVFSPSDLTLMCEEYFRRDEAKCSSLFGNLKGNKLIFLENNLPCHPLFLSTRVVNAFKVDLGAHRIVFTYFLYSLSPWFYPSKKKR